MSKTANPTKEAQVNGLFKLGAHFGYDRARQHPTTKPYIFGYKNRTAIIDLEKTVDLLDTAKTFAYEAGARGKTLMLVGGKKEAIVGIRKVAEAADLPYVAGRWLGGTLTNVEQIRRRITRLNDLKDQKTKGELVKYTKKERLMIGQEIEELEESFGHLGDMKQLPAALFVIDPDQERIAVKEANSAKISVIALANSDCNLRGVDYPIVGNDSARESIAYFALEIANAYNQGKANPQPKADQLSVGVAPVADTVTT